MITYFDMFSGIGGFRAGLSRVGGFRCVGHCEIDKYADKSYRAIFCTEGEFFCDDAKKIDTGQMPDFDMLCAGFPCQPFSRAGKRQGFNDTRGSLFFEIARLVGDKRPKYVFLENVPALLTHDKGKTFSIILNSLSELGYHVEWQVLDSKDFGVPHSRKRVFAFCYLNTGCAGKIFPIRDANEQALKQIVGGWYGQRIYDPEGLSCTLTSEGGGKAGKCGLYFIDLNENPKITDTARCIKSRYNSGISNRSSENSGVLVIEDSQFAADGITRNGRVRKLLPAECLRLQGFDEYQIDKLIAVNSDNQLYKQAGNSVTVNVIQRIGVRIKQMDDAFST